MPIVYSMMIFNNSFGSRYYFITDHTILCDITCNRNDTAVDTDAQ